MENNTKAGQAKEVNARKLSGVVVSDKMAKTVVVRVEAVEMHSKYHKRFTISRRYKVHDEKGVYHTGDKVTFVACRPMSKEKRFRVLYQ